jgi:hypothetical protein
MIFYNDVPDMQRLKMSSSSLTARLRDVLPIALTKAMISTTATAAAFTALRFAARWKRTIFGIDDWILLVAMVR